MQESAEAIVLYGIIHCRQEGLNFEEQGGGTNELRSRNYSDRSEPIWRASISQPGARLL